MRTKCTHTPLPVEHNFGPDWLKEMFRTHTKIVGAERMRVHASLNSFPDVACFFMTMNTVSTNSESEPRSHSTAVIPRDDKTYAWHEGKFKEELRAKICGMLIDAQEKERAWISRELHDDICQRIALLAVNLDQWEKDIPPSTPEVHEHIQEVSRNLSEIFQGIRALSHHLHSSNLDYLGLASAASGLCKEVAEKHNVEIDFSQTGIPRKVPKEISLCLFRVLQEALQNAVKHSGVKHFRVELRGTPDKIQLVVNDCGAGFSLSKAESGSGLGLISMRERMNLVDGEFLVRSEPHRGTTIYASAPLVR